MTLDMNNTDKLCVYYQDAQKNGLKIIPPDINMSDSDFIIDYSNNAIIYSLAAVRGSGEHVVQEIVKERNTRGPYQSIFDFIERIEPLKILNRRFVENFIKSGAFDKLHKSRKQLFDSLDIIMSVKPATEQESLFEKTYPQLVYNGEWTETEKLQNEFSAIGFYISSHPVLQYEQVLKQLKLPSLAEARELSKSRVVVIINGFTFKTSKNQKKFCVLQISDHSGIAEASAFSETLDKGRELIKVGNIVVLDITCYQNEEQTRILIDKIQNFDAKNTAQLKSKSFSSPSASASSPTSSSFSKTSTNSSAIAGISASLASKTLQVKINTKEELITIKNLIDNFRKNGNYSIELLLPEKIVLPDKYFLTSYDILDLRNTVGVKNVVEA
jgi:DNA polymerase-3 subunit alpha